MALPPYLAEKLKSVPMDPTVLATDLELAYLLSFASNSNSSFTQKCLMTLFISIQDRSINLHLSTINSLIFKIKHLSSFSKRLRKTTKVRTSK